MLKALKVDRNNTYITADARYSLGILGRRALVHEPRFGAKCNLRMHAFLMGIQEFSNIYDDEYKIMIPSQDTKKQPKRSGYSSERDKIDVGEALLLTAVSEGEFLIATGDKRCLRALANNEKFEKTFNRVRGRIVCLEQIVRIVVSKHGFEFVRNRLGINGRIDNAIRQCFGIEMPASEQSVMECLESNINYINKTSREILASPELLSS